MSFGETVALGAIAGSTIFIGLPVGRMRAVGDRGRVCLAMLSVGILAFIFMDVTKHAEGIVEAALSAYKAGTDDLGRVIGLFALMALGFTLGTAGISAAERWLRGRRAQLAPLAGGEAEAVLEPAQIAHAELGAADARRRALQTGMVIAIAIGLHNFAEGLAIGVSAKTGEIALATVLVIGFGLHNATEGFGIVGPLGDVRPSWRWLAVAGLVGGGPTFLGTIVGYQVDSQALELTFYALAGGAILYVIGEIWTGMRRYGNHTLGLYMIAAGFLLGVATDLIVSYGGA
jgi:zinc transporter, ZIP family